MKVISLKPTLMKIIHCHVHCSKQKLQVFAPQKNGRMTYQFEPAQHSFIMICSQRRIDSSIEKIARFAFHVDV